MSRRKYKIGDIVCIQDSDVGKEFIRILDCKHSNDKEYELYLITNYTNIMAIDWPQSWEWHFLTDDPYRSVQHYKVNNKRLVDILFKADDV